jgi:hypothetical protein
MQELQVRLHAELRARQMSPRQASIAATQNPNVIGNILSNAVQAPTLETLVKLARYFGWRLCDTICWAYDWPLELLEDEPPPNTVARGLERWGMREASQRQAVLAMIGAMLPAPSSVRSSSQ